MIDLGIALCMSCTTSEAYAPFGFSAVSLFSSVTVWFSGYTFWAVIPHKPDRGWQSGSCVCWQSGTCVCHRGALCRLSITSPRCPWMIGSWTPPGRSGDLCLSPEPLLSRWPSCRGRHYGLSRSGHRGCAETPTTN